MRIVYVEDDYANVSLVARILYPDKHEVLSYEDAENALENLHYDQPDIVLADHMLAGNLNGLEMVRRLRAAGYENPIIAVTAHAEKKDCLNAGCDHFFAKPLPVQEFRTLIQDYATHY